MKLFFDTEFYEDGREIKLISIGVVREDGREYYAETREAARLSQETAWLVENVHPHLQGGDTVKLRADIAREIVEFAGDKPQWWAWYADYDWVVLCQLFGRMIDLPKGWPMYCRDYKQHVDYVESIRGYRVELPMKPANAHNALEDARWLYQAAGGIVR